MGKNWKIDAIVWLYELIKNYICNITMFENKFNNTENYYLELKQLDFKWKLWEGWRQTQFFYELR